MSRDQDKLTLELLPDQVLLEVAAFLEPWPPINPYWVSPLYAEHKNCCADVVSLSCVSKRIRYALQPAVFRKLSLGDRLARPGIVSEASDQRISAIEKHGAAFLSHVRVVLLYPTTNSGLGLLTKCLKRMHKLVVVDYCIAASIPSVWVDALAGLSTFHTLMMDLGSVESLPTLLPLGPRLKGLHLQALRHGVPFPWLIQYSPLTVAPLRRSRLPLDMENVATEEEHISAWDKGLAKLLLAAKDSLVWITLHPSLAPGDEVALEKMDPEQYLPRLFAEMKRLSKTNSFPTFPRLERLGLNTSTHNSVIQHILNTSPNLTTMDTAGSESLKAPLRELTNLRTLHYLFDEHAIVAPSVRTFIRGATLQNLGLNGIQGDDLASLFSSAPTELRHLRKLHLLVHQIGPLTQSAVNAVVAACPDLVHLAITSGLWVLEADWFLKKIGSSLPRLLTFSLDHPYEHPRFTPFLTEPDGRTIRSERYGHFRVVTTRGNTPEQEIIRRIREDIDAVRPRYLQRFRRFAKRTRVELIEWHATDEVIWSWRFEHVGNSLIISDEAEIEGEASAMAAATVEDQGGGATMWLTQPRVRA